jgi:DNA-binding MarR family transcriptional regulator
MIGSYLDAIAAIERLRHGHMAVIERVLELNEVNGITYLDALILAAAERSKLSVNQIKNRINRRDGHISSIIRKLARNGYIYCNQSCEDRRTIHLWLSDKGQIVSDLLREMRDPISDGDARLERAVRTLRQVEQLLINEELATPSANPQPT